MAAEDLLRDVRTSGGPESYQKWATRYDELLGGDLNYIGFKSIVSKWLQYHEDVLKSKIKQKVLDVGCGTGYIGEHMASVVPREAYDIYGGDFSPDMLEVAKTKNAYTSLRVVNLKKDLPYDPESFDSIVSSGVFSKSHCHADCFPNVLRVLKKGGYFIPTVKKDLYELTKDEWEKYTKESNCEIIEMTDMPYHDDSSCLVFVIRKN